MEKSEIYFYWIFFRFLSKIEKRKDPCMSSNKVFLLLLIVIIGFSLSTVGAAENRRKEFLENPLNRVRQEGTVNNRASTDGRQAGSFDQLKDIYSGNINVFFGQKKLHRNDWFPVEKQKEYGVEFDFKEKRWPLSLLLTYFISEEDSSGVPFDNGKTQEIQVGVKKIFEFQHVRTRPFVSSGITYIRAEQSISSDSCNITKNEESSNTAGFFVGGGCYIILRNEINIGFYLNYSNARVLLFDERKKAGGLHFGMLTGFHF